LFFTFQNLFQKHDLSCCSRFAELLSDTLGSFHCLLWHDNASVKGHRAVKHEQWLANDSQRWFSETTGDWKSRLLGLLIPEWQINLLCTFHAKLTRLANAVTMSWAPIVLLLNCFNFFSHYHYYSSGVEQHRRPL